MTRFSSSFSLEWQKAALPSHGERRSQQNPSRRRRTQPPRPMSHHGPPSLPPYSTRWLGNINYYLHAALARVQLECGGLLNVSALCFHFWLNHQITVCLRSQVRRFLLCQAGVLPRLSLRFVNLCLVASGDKHLRTSTVRKHEVASSPSPPTRCCARVPPACNLRCKVKHHFQPTGWETQASADTNHLFTQPVCLFDTCRLWFTLENTAKWHASQVRHTRG